MTTDVRLTSGLTRTVFFIFLWRESIFWGEKKRKKRFFSENRATRRPRRHSICLPYTAGGMHSQNKHDRHRSIYVPGIYVTNTRIFKYISNT